MKLNWYMLSKSMFFLILCLTFDIAPANVGMSDIDFEKVKRSEETYSDRVFTTQKAEAFLKLFGNDGSVDEEQLANWFFDMNKWDKKYDEYLIKKQTFLMSFMLEFITSEHDSSEGCRQFRVLEGIYKSIVENHELWDKNKQYLGYKALHGVEDAQKKQNNRKNGFQDFFKLIKKYYKESAGKNVSGLTAGRGRCTSVALISSAVMCFPLMALYRVIAYHLIKTPTARLMMACQRKAYNKDSQGDVFVEWHDQKRNILASSDEVNLFLVSHRNAVLDSFLLSHLKLPSALVFGNAAAVAQKIDQNYYRFYGKLIASCPDFIAVGRIKGFRNLSAMEQLTSSLSSGYSPNVVNYPQGFISDFNEVLGVTPVLNEKLINYLLKKKYRIRIFPVSYDTPNEMFPDSKKDIQHTVTVHESISPEVVSKISELESNDEYPNLLGMYLRSLWHSSIKCYPEIKIDDFFGRLSNKLGVEIMINTAQSH